MGHLPQVKALAQEAFTRIRAVLSKPSFLAVTTQIRTGAQPREYCELHHVATAVLVGTAHSKGLLASPRKKTHNRNRWKGADNGFGAV